MIFLAKTRLISSFPGRAGLSVEPDERSIGILRPQERDECLGIADREGVEQGHRLVDRNVGEGFRVGVEVRVLQDALHET